MPKRGRLEASPSARAGDAKVAPRSLGFHSESGRSAPPWPGAELAGEAAREAPSPAALPGRPSVDSRVLNDPVVDSHVLTAGTDTPALISPAYVSLYAVDKLVSQEKIKITGTRVERHGPHVRSHLDTVVAP